MVPRSYADVYDPFHPKEHILDVWKAFADAHQIPYTSIGKTFEGNDILLFELGNPNGGKVLWNAYLHGNEDYGAEILFMLLEWLFSGDSRAERILERNNILFVPVVNVDARHGAGYHERGNRHFYAESPEYGVDLNRNFERGWRHQGLHSATYSGPSAASEPETQVIRNALDTYRPAFYVDLHQGSTNAPWARYYTGGASNNTLSQHAVSRINDLSDQMDITPFPMGTIGSTGFAVGDAGGEYGASAWLVEVDPRWTHTDAIYQDLVDTMYPKSLLMFIAMCELCESDIPSNARADVNGDEIVNVMDVTIVSLSYGTFEGEPNYNPEADITKDGIVDMGDLVVVARHLGETVA
jgi:hypothetical protein